MAGKAVEWDKIKAEYLAGDATYAELAKKYEVSLSTLSKKATKEGWKNGRKKVGEKVAKKMETRAAHAREEKALKGVQLARYITDLWTDNLKALNTLIEETPEYLLANPAFASGIPRGLRETYDLIMEMNGKGYVNRKLANEQRKLKLEREKFEFEKQKWEEQRAQMERGLKAGTRETWIIEEEEDGSDDGFDG